MVGRLISLLENLFFQPIKLIWSKLVVAVWSQQKISNENANAYEHYVNCGPKRNQNGAKIGARRGKRAARRAKGEAKRANIEAKRAHMDANKPKIANLSQNVEKQIVFDGFEGTEVGAPRVVRVVGGPWLPRRRAGEDL